MEFLIMVDIFSIFLFNLEVYSQDKLKKLRLQIKLIFFPNTLIYIWIKLPNQIKNRKSVENFKIKLDDFRKNDLKKNLRGHFWELLYELLNRIWSVYVLC